MQGEFVVVGYKLHGSGPVCVLALHGWFGDATDFDNVAAALDPRVYSVAAVDYRGYGKSIELPGPFTIAQIAQDALDLADRLGWTSFDVIGHSMGGKAALRLAALAPKRVRRVVGVTPVFAAPVPFDCDTVDLFARAADEISLRANIISTTTGDRLSSYWSNKMAQRSTANSRKDAFAAYFRSWSGDDHIDDVPAVQQPILVLGGTYDASLTEEVLRATWMASFPQAQLQMLPDAGHYPMMEAPLSLASRIETFLAD